METRKYDYLIFPEWKSEGASSTMRSCEVERWRERERGATTTKSFGRLWKGMIGEARSMIQTTAQARYNLTQPAQLFEREREGGLVASVLPQSIAALF